MPASLFERGEYYDAAELLLGVLEEETEGEKSAHERARALLLRVRMAQGEVDAAEALGASCEQLGPHSELGTVASLTQPIDTVPARTVVNPSDRVQPRDSSSRAVPRQPETGVSAEPERHGARTRGEVIHRMLESLTSRGKRADQKRALQTVFGAGLDATAFEPRFHYILEILFSQQIQTVLADST